MDYFKVNRFFFYFLLLFCSYLTVEGQDKYTALQEKLVLLSSGEIPTLNEKVNISVTNVSLQEFIRGIANSTALNINVDPSINIQIVNNFSDVKVIDVLLFLCRQYDLNISVIGNILNIYKERKEEIIPPKRKLVYFDAATNLVSIDCDNEDLTNLAKEMTNLTGFNVVPAPGMDRIKVSGYIQKMPVENALEKFAFANNLKIRKTDDQVFLVEKNEPIPPVANTKKEGNRSAKKGPGDTDLQIRMVGTDSISIIANKAGLDDIIINVAEELNTDYFFSTPVQGEATLNIKAISFPDLLDFIFRNTNYSYQKLDKVYLIGDNKGREMKDFRLLQLQNRPVEKLMEVVPAELTRDMEIKEFPELNGFLIGGVPARIQLLERFLKSIDQVVPVILIEVMIIDIQKNYNISTGIEAGLGEKPVTTGGKVFPEVDLSLGAQSINNLINSFNGFGTVKIGKVTPNFYVNLKAMETDGIINIRSTPKLSTLNGHEANMSIGNTEYYLEEQSSIYGSLSAQQTITRNYKAVTAELSLKIKPVVSGDDQITLDIEVNQGDFTNRISQYAPPGEVSRKFKSLIRVKNQEMVLLGGLEEKRVQDSGTGVPLLARIPIIKWLFSSNTRERSKSKLNIFIKPTIID